MYWNKNKYKNCIYEYIYKYIYFNVYDEAETGEHHQGCSDELHVKSKQI